MYDGQCLIAEKDSSGDVQTSYTIGKGEVVSRTDWSGQTPASVFFLYDGNCNLDAVVDEGGNLVKQFTYDVFGAVRETLVGSGAETVGFSGGIGHITDLENSLVYMRARYYDPALGRFISEDPGSNGTNWYIYCQNNPVNAIDPEGRKTIWLSGNFWIRWDAAVNNVLRHVHWGRGNVTLGAANVDGSIHDAGKFADWPSNKEMRMLEGGSLQDAAVAAAYDTITAAFEQNPLFVIGLFLDLSGDTDTANDFYAASGC